MTVSAKRIRVSDDAGTNLYTLPGNSGNITRDGASVDDTLFGQNFKSSQPTLIDGKVTSSAMYRGYAGYVATLKKAGSTTATTGEATSLVSTRVYQITNTAKRIFDRAVAITVLDGVTDVTGQVLSIDYLFGIVTFKGSYTVIGAVTVTYNYFPVATIAKANSYSLTQNAAATETTDYATAQANSGHKTFQAGLKTVALELKGFYDVSNGFEALLDARAELILEVCADGVGKSIARGFFKPVSDQNSGNVGAIEDYTLKFELTVPDDSLMTVPFNWVHTATLLSTAVQKVITAWLNGTTLMVQYLPDGSTGFSAAACVVTDITMAGSVGGMNTFTTNFQISGVIAAV